MLSAVKTALGWAYAKMFRSYGFRPCRSQTVAQDPEDWRPAMTSTPRPVELRYDPAAIDRKWQERWERDGIHRVDNEDPRPKWYEMTMYPYPSGDLHIGHWYAMAPADCHARFPAYAGVQRPSPNRVRRFWAAGRKRRHQPWYPSPPPGPWKTSPTCAGSFVPSERFTIGTGRLFAACPSIIGGTSGCSSSFTKRDLAYRGRAPVVWCPSCQTVLANEQVLNGACERCGATITRRDLEQWFLRITGICRPASGFPGIGGLAG